MKFTSHLLVKPLSRLHCRSNTWETMSSTKGTETGLFKSRCFLMGDVSSWKAQGDLQWGDEPQEELRGEPLEVPGVLRIPGRVNTLLSSIRQQQSHPSRRPKLSPGWKLGGGNKDCHSGLHPVAWKPSININSRLFKCEVPIAPALPSLWKMHSW